MTQARLIYQTLLDRLTAALEARDLTGFSAQVALPYILRGVDGGVVLQTEAETEHAVARYVDALRSRGVTRIERFCDTAHFVSPDHVSGYHTTRIMAGDTPEIAPFLTRASLYQRKGTWRVGVSDTSLRSADWEVFSDWFRTEGEATPMPPASAADQRLHLFQSILDRISTAFLAGDGQAWLDAIHLPVHLITRQGVETFATPEDVLRDFDRYVQEFETHGVTSIVRQAKTAEIIDGDQMVGTYRTHILRGSDHVVPPWDGSMTLRRNAGLWRVTTVMRAIGHLNWSAISPIEIEDIPQDTPTKGETQ